MTTQRCIGLIGVVITTFATGTAAAPAAPTAHPPAEATRPKADRPPVALDYKRDARPERDDDPAPQEAPDVPAELKVPPRAAAARSAPPRAAEPRGPAPDAEELGAQAGERMALEAAHEWGWRQYWRAGFHRGMRDALADARPGRWDHEAGLSSGRRDPRALVLGGEIARESAQDAARRAAADQVRDQFTDLSREPRRQSTAARRYGDVDRLIPAGPWAVAPVYDEVFAAFPLSGTARLSREARAALERWDVQPQVLARDTQPTRAYDGAWKDAAYAFAVWRDRQGRGSRWSRFDAGERDRCRTAFFAEFDATLGALDLRSTYAGYRVGYADGWRYGAAVNAEWHYRQGYAEGFDLGVRAAAALAFPLLYDRAYDAAYDDEFSQWTRSAVPALGALRWSDDNDDGVIEPGESIELTGEVLNYGGAPGSFEVRAAAAALEAPGATTVRLPARGRVELPAIALRVNDRTAPRTHARVDVTIGDARADVPLYVARPLEIDGDALVDAEPLAGRARVVVTVVNRSRRALNAEVLFTDAEGRSREEHTERTAIPAGGAVKLSREYTGLRPLDLLSGAVRWQASVRHDDVQDDTRFVELASAATNLADPDLVTYMLGLARTRRPAPRDVAEARALMLARMRVDWDRACAMDGNPYKLDLEQGSASTALGELVRQVGADRGSFANREVFAGLGADIAALAEDLPGAHPLLRKWMKRLAKRVS